MTIVGVHVVDSVDHVAWMAFDCELASLNPHLILTVTQGPWFRVLWCTVLVVSSAATKTKLCYSSLLHGIVIRAVPQRGG